MSGENALVEARKLTSALRRVRHTMEGSLGQAHEAMSTLASDGEIITETHDEHKVELKGALRTAGHRLNKMMRVDLLEKYCVSLSLAFFFSVVAFIVIRRTRILVLLYRLAMHFFAEYIYNPETDKGLLDVANELLDRGSRGNTPSFASMFEELERENASIGNTDEL
jgi:hypothetical protein